jgi:hypothetical protein
VRQAIEREPAEVVGLIRLRLRGSPRQRSAAKKKLTRWPRSARCTTWAKLRSSGASSIPASSRASRQIAS